MVEKFIQQLPGRVWTQPEQLWGLAATCRRRDFGALKTLKLIWGQIWWFSGSLRAWQPLWPLEEEIFGLSNPLNWYGDKFDNFQSLHELISHQRMMWMFPFSARTSTKKKKKSKSSQNIVLPQQIFSTDCKKILSKYLKGSWQSVKILIKKTQSEYWLKTHGSVWSYCWL